MYVLGMLCAQVRSWYVLVTSADFRFIEHKNKETNCVNEDWKSLATFSLPLIILAEPLLLANEATLETKPDKSFNKAAHQQSTA